MIQQRTHGILVHQATIPNAGNFSIWDFSGLKSYYIIHEEFLHTKNAVIMLVFKVNDSSEQQLAQLRFWLSLIKAKQDQSGTIRFAGELDFKPHVVLVGSFSNLPYMSPEGGNGTLTVPLPTSTHGRHGPDLRKVHEVVNTVRKEFKDYFEFSQLFQLDCRLSQTNEIKALRNHLGVLRSEIVQVS
jgi:hypothetical protein